MNRIIASLRDGTWLPEARVTRLATAAVAGTIVFLLFLAVTAHGLIDYSGRPLGTDFSSFYAAGRLAGSGADPYDRASLHAMEKAIFGDGTPYHAFAHPPIFLLLARPLAMLAYLPSLVVWQVSMTIAYGAQVIVAILVILASLRLWRSGADPRLKGAALCVGTLLTTSFALDYDLMLLAPVILMIVAYMIEKPVIPFGVTLVFILWLMPLFVRGIAAAILLPLANWVLAVCFLMLIKQARTQ